MIYFFKPNLVLTLRTKLRISYKNITFKNLHIHQIFKINVKKNEIFLSATVFKDSE